MLFLTVVKSSLPPPPGPDLALGEASALGAIYMRQVAPKDKFTTDMFELDMS